MRWFFAALIAAALALALAGPFKTAAAAAPPVSRHGQCTVYGNTYATWYGWRCGG